MKIRLLGLMLSVGILAASSPASADWDYGRGDAFSRPHFYLGASGVGVAVLGETGPRSFLHNGGGFSLFLGGRVARVFGIELAWQPTFHNQEMDIFGRQVGTIGLQAFTVDGKLYPARGPVQPYFMIGVGAYALGDNFNIFAEGFGYQIGGGVDFWVSRGLSIGIKAQYRGVELRDYDRYNDNTYLSLLTFAADLTGHF